MAMAAGLRFVMLERRDPQRNAMPDFVEPRFSEAGATGVEYAILVALIGGVIIGTVALLGIQVLDMFLGFCGEMSTAAGWVCA
jgi:Flp pilus assembly pilin Flp